MTVQSREEGGWMRCYWSSMLPARAPEFGPDLQAIAAVDKLVA